MLVKGLTIGVNDALDLLVGFYQDTDLSIGQFLELSLNGQEICPSLLILLGDENYYLEIVHTNNYSHFEGRSLFYVNPPIFGGFP